MIRTDVSRVFINSPLNAGGFQHFINPLLDLFRLHLLITMHTEYEHVVYWIYLGVTLKINFSKNLIEDLDVFLYSISLLKLGCLWPGECVAPHFDWLASLWRRNHLQHVCVCIVRVCYWWSRYSFFRVVWGHIGQGSRLCRFSGKKKHLHVTVLSV